jgi:hypothetical protein
MEPVTIIHVSDQAFMTILLSGLEAYKVALAEDEEQNDAVEQVPMEFFGHLFGTCTVREEGKYFSVEHVSIDSTALQGDVGVRPNPHSLMLKDALINFCWPHYQYLGYVHSHPYESAKEMQSNKGFLLSDEDKEYCDAYDDILLLMSIGKLTYPPEGEPCFYKDKSNVLKLEIANFRILLSAYSVDLSEEDEECDDDVQSPYPVPIKLRVFPQLLCGYSLPIVLQKETAAVPQGHCGDGAGYTDFASQQ